MAGERGSRRNKISFAILLLKTTFSSKVLKNWKALASESQSQSENVTCPRCEKKEKGEIERASRKQS
jgi:hypothetical protein